MRMRLTTKTTKSTLRNRTTYQSWWILREMEREIGKRVRKREREWEREKLVRKKERERGGQRMRRGSVIIYGTHVPTSPRTSFISALSTICRRADTICQVFSVCYYYYYFPINDNHFLIHKSTSSTIKINNIVISF